MKPMNLFGCFILLFSPRYSPWSGHRDFKSMPRSGKGKATTQFQSQLFNKAQQHKATLILSISQRHLNSCSTNSMTINHRDIFWAQAIKTDMVPVAGEWPQQKQQNIIKKKKAETVNSCIELILIILPRLDIFIKTCRNIRKHRPVHTYKTDKTFPTFFSV